MALHPVFKTATASIIGFTVGAGAASGIYTTIHETRSAAQAAEYAKPGSFGPDAISDVVQRVSPAVVKVIGLVPESDSISPLPWFNPFLGIAGAENPERSATEIGSGFFINAQGYVLTNAHVVQGANPVRVDVPGYEAPLPARVVGIDPETDLAVLKVSLSRPVPALSLGNSRKTPVGAWAIAIGNPYNLSHTVTVGVISAKGRPVAVGGRQYRDLLQTSAAINPGNSGGPLLNLRGQVIGINTAVSAEAQGIGFAIPTSTVETILPKLMQHAGEL